MKQATVSIVRDPEGHGIGYLKINLLHPKNWRLLLLLKGPAWLIKLLDRIAPHPHPENYTTADAAPGTSSPFDQKD